MICCTIIIGVIWELGLSWYLVFRTFSTNLNVFAKYGNWGLYTCSFRIKYRKKTLMSVFTRVVHRFHSKTTTPPVLYKAIFSANATFNRSLRIFFSPLDNCFEWIPEGICCTRNFFSYSSNPNTLSWPGSQNIHHVIRYKSVPWWDEQIRK